MQCFWMQHVASNIRPLRCVHDNGHDGGHEYAVQRPEEPARPTGLPIDPVDLDDPSDADRCARCGLTQCSGRC